MVYKQANGKIAKMPLCFVTIIIATVLLISAIYIYMSNRSVDMELYSWLGIDTKNSLFKHVRNLSYNFAPWAKYNLPDGLWLLSFLLLMEGIWDNETLIKWLFCIPIIVFAFVSEILQFNGFLSGTGDIIDMFFYIAAILLLLIFIKLKQMYYEKIN